MRVFETIDDVFNYYMSLENTGPTKDHQIKYRDQF